MKFLENTITNFKESTLGYILIFFALVFFALVPLKIHYSNSGLFDIILLSTIGLMSLGTYLIIKDYKLQEGVPLFICIAIFPIFGYLQSYIYDDLVKERLLAKDGVKSFGIVKELWVSNSKGSKGDWLFTMTYDANGRTITTPSEEDEFKELKVGDTIKIEFSQSVPEAYRFIEE